MEGSQTGGPINLSGHNTTTSEVFAELCDAAGRQDPRWRLPAAASMLPVIVTELVYAGIGKPAPLPAIVMLLLCEQDWQERSAEQTALGQAPRGFQDTARDTVNWYRRLGYC